MLGPGSVVDRFTVEARLGEGGMAAVYRVRHNTLGSAHALKLLKIEGEHLQARLVLEGQVQASLRHPNIVAVTDVVFVGRQPGLVMELVPGPTLAEWLYTYEPSFQEADRLFRGVLAGVARAHRAGLVHRDLKPGNVLLDESDGQPLPKVTDFGLTKILDEDGGNSQTRSGVSMGTPQYMAPEQIRDAKNVDQRADIWALGCILYEIYTGRPPFRDEDIIELYGAISAARYIPVEQLVPEVPPGVAVAIRGCLEVSREARLPDCDAIRQLLGPPAQAAPPGAPRAVTTRRAPQLRGEPLVPGETCLPSLAPKGAAGAGSIPAATLPSAAVERVPSREGRRAWPALLAVGALGLAATLGVAAALLLGLTDDAPPPAPAQPSAVSPARDVGPGAVTSPRPAELTRPSPEAATTATSVGAAPTRPPGRRDAQRSAAPQTQPSAEEAAAATAAPSEATETGRVVVQGEVERVVLYGDERASAPGEVPVGRWRAVVTFAGRAPIDVGPFEVRAGQTVTLACSASFVNCSVE